MAVAMMYPEPQDPKLGVAGLTPSATEGVSSGRLSMARTVLRALPADAEEVELSVHLRCCLIAHNR
jgi:hypothetical protein